MDHNAIDKKEFQEARTKPPKVAQGVNGDFTAFLCVFCNWLLSIPYQSYCGDRACYKCFKLLAQKIKQNGRETVKCPGCGEGIIPELFFPDKAATRELNTLHVACPNEGCSWEGQYCDYEDHFNKCPQLRVKCPYEQCKEMVLRKNMDKHTKKCGFRPSQCEYCGAETTFNHLQDHWDMCDEFPLPCSEGCGEKVPRGLMKAHMNKDCAMVRRTCDYRIRTFHCNSDDSSQDTATAANSQRRRELLECNFPIEDLLTQLQGDCILTEYESEEIQSTPNHVEKNRRFFKYLRRKDEETLEGTLAILSQPQFRSYHYLGDILAKLFSAQSTDITPSQHVMADIHTLQATSYTGVYIWKVPELTRRKRDAVLGKTISLYSAPFFTSRHGYKLCLRIYLNGDGSGRGTHISFFICLMKGEFDPLLPWPFKQTVSLSLLAQNGVSQDITQSFKPDADSSSLQMPKSEMNVASGCPQFCSLAVLDNPSYAQGDTIFLKGAINLRGIEHIS